MNETLVRYVRHFPNFERYCLGKGNIYRAIPLGKYFYGIYARDYDVKLCEVTLKQLNYYFEKVK